MVAETIFALASGPGVAGVAVYRISGPEAFAAAEMLTGPLPRPRTMALRTVLDPESGHHVDTGLVVRFPGPHSFTGEDMVELHLHGGVAIQRATAAVLSRREGLRAAEPGEFTRRALMNGRLDLAQVEGLGDLIAAETEVQRSQAHAVANGALSALTEEWRGRVLDALALIEAAIDFADEDLDGVGIEAAAEDLNALVQEMGREVEASHSGERVRSGFEVAIVGRPNVGKSTLLNAFARREAALVSDIPGTTRDIIEVRMDFDGLPVTLLDTAGLRDAQDLVEGLGVARGVERARGADLRVFLCSGALDIHDIPLNPEAEDLIVQAKADACDEIREGLRVSGLTGQGLGELQRAITGVLQRRASKAGAMSRERHRSAVVRAIHELNQGLAREPGNEDLAAADLRSAVIALDVLTGKVDVEQVLDRVFESFCIGK